jgi:hypothetical protein
MVLWVVISPSKFCDYYEIIVLAAVEIDLYSSTYSPLVEIPILTAEVMTLLSARMC